MSLADTGYGPQGVSGEAISSFVSANIGDPGAIASAASRYGLSASDLAAATGYSPAEQAAYFGSAGVDTSGISGLAGLFGGSSGATGGGAQPTYGTGNFTVDTIKNYIAANLGDPGAIARAMEQYNVTQQDLSNIYQGTYTPQQISSYLSQPTAALYGTGPGGQYTGQEIVNYIQQNLNDPATIYHRSMIEGVTPQNLADISKIYAPGITEQLIQDYLSTGKGGYETRFGEKLGSVFGSKEEQQSLANQMYNSFIAEVYSLPNLTKQQKQALVSQYTPQSLYEKNFAPSSYVTKSFDEIEKILEASPQNRHQEAGRLADIAKNYLGYDQKEVKDLVSRAMSNKGLTEVEQTIYAKLLDSHKISGDDYEALMMYTAVNNPEANVFKDKPQLLEFYTPIGAPQSAPTMLNSSGQDTGRGRSGQYGVYNGMPILNANVLKEAVGTDGALRTPSGEVRTILEQQIVPNLGIDFHSWTESTNVLAGNSVVGINFDRQYINDLAKFEDGIRSGSIIAAGDPESGRTTYYQVVQSPQGTYGQDNYSPYTYVPIEPPSPKSDPNTLAGKYAMPAGMYGGTFAPTSLSELQSKLNEAAQKVGVDPTNKSLTQQFDEISEKTRGLYQITGSAINAGMADDNGKYTNTMTLKESRDALNPENKNHFSATYREVGDKLIPVSTNFFNFDPPKKGGFGPIGGFVGDMLSGIASIPFVAELTLATPLAPYYPAVKAIQVGGLTGDLDEGLKAGAKAWILQQGVQFADAAIGNALIDAGLTDISTVNALANVGANVASNMGIAALSGESLSDAGIAALVMSALSAGTKGAAKELNIPTQYQPVVAQLLTDAILKQDMEKSLTNLALKTVGNEVKDLLKETKKETASA